MITEHAIAAAHLLESPQSIRPRTRAAPHLFALNEQSVPVVIVWIDAEQPMVAFRFGAANVRSGAGQGTGSLAFFKSQDADLLASLESL